MKGIVALLTTGFVTLALGLITWGRLTRAKILTSARVALPIVELLSEARVSLIGS